MKNLIIKIYKLFRKFLVDLASTLYDDQDFKVMSLPRFNFFFSGLCICVSWIAMQFLGYNFEHFGLLIAWNGASGGSYMVKKFTEMGKPIITPEEKPTPVPTELLTGRAE